MISAVWGRAPPAIVPPYDPPVPPLCPETDQDSLSVMKTRAASAGAVVAGLSCASDETARENIRPTEKEIFAFFPQTEPTRFDRRLHYPPIAAAVNERSELVPSEITCLLSKAMHSVEKFDTFLGTVSHGK